MKIYQHRISFQSWLALLALVLVSWFIINHITLLLELIWILFGAFILSMIIRPVAERLAQQHIPRGLTVILAYTLIVAFVYAIFHLLAPVVTVEAASLRRVAPTLAEQATARIHNTTVAQWLPSTDNLLQRLNQQLDTLLFGALTTVEGLGAALLDLLIILILAYFFTTATYAREQLFWRWLSPMQRSHLQAIFATSYQRLTRWVWTQLGLGLYHAIFFVIGLLVLKVPFALTIGLLGGVLSLIPYLGVALAALLAALSVLPHNPFLSLWVILYMVAVAVIGSHVVTPIFYGRTVGLNSTVVLVALFVGAQLQGIIGVIFAIPIAVIISTIYQEFTLVLPAVQDKPVQPTTLDQQQEGSLHA
ncbi:MAG: AI-2E family transporter [Caldilineaceae bacterium]